MKLAIKGHATRGKEIIQLLEMLGGKSISNMGGYNDALYYYITNDNLIYCTGIEYEELICDYVKFTLEEFEEKFPYKVGDCVSSKYCKNYKIEKEVWDSRYNKVIYKLQGMGWYNVEELQPYKEETMETITIDDFKANTKEWLIDKLHGMIISNAIKTIGNIHDELHKPQYPKTYDECYDVLGVPNDERYVEVDNPVFQNKLIESFTELLICRNAYWKVYGEQMGLGKLWKPNWKDCKDKFCITIFKNKPIFDDSQYINRVLTFPTEEMRDAFYENFRERIEQCKELL